MSTNGLMRQRLARALPLLGVAVAALLLWQSTQAYLGGTPEDPNTTGYDWERNFFSALFREVAWNGAANTARPWALSMMTLTCLPLTQKFAVASSAGWVVALQQVDFRRPEIRT
ncbi:MAG: hypothetical protein RL026_1419 [Pseudomonadota bacterium]